MTPRERAEAVFNKTDHQSTSLLWRAAKVVRIEWAIKDAIAEEREACEAICDETASEVLPSEFASPGERTEWLRACNNIKVKIQHRKWD